jgi:hypothetical protein
MFADTKALTLAGLEKEEVLAGKFPFPDNLQPAKSGSQ